MEQQPLFFPTQNGLGAVRRPRDDRDWSGTSFIVPGMGAPLTPQQLLNLYIYMQGTLGTCGAHSIQEILNILANFTGSPQYMWDYIKTIDGLPADWGTDMRSMFKVAQKWGSCDLTLLGDDYTVGLTEYTRFSKITPPMTANGQQRLVTNYSFVDNPTWQQIIDAIAQHKAVSLLVDCGDGWWKDAKGNSTWSEQGVLPLKVGNFVSHHFITAAASDGQYIWGLNHWSKQWGHNGLFYFDKTYLPHVLEMGIPLSINQAQYIFHTDLSLDMKSEDVKQLQIRLVLPEKYQTGYFGPITESAVKLYQGQHNLPTTGYVGPLTRALLNTQT